MTAACIGACPTCCSLVADDLALASAPSTRLRERLAREIADLIDEYEGRGATTTDLRGALLDALDVVDDARAA